jgi:DNA-directed RNA polymerase subunit RPC12/RpoP
MEKKYFVDVFSYVCPACKQRVSDKAYFAVIEEREIGAARRAGLLTYKCTHCGASHSSKSVHTNGEVTRVSKEQALAHGLTWESKESA